MGIHRESSAFYCKKIGFVLWCGTSTVGLKLLCDRRKATTFLVLSEMQGIADLAKSIAEITADGKEEK